MSEQIPIDELVVSDLNERKHNTEPSEEMVRDIRDNGVQDAIEVRPTDKEGYKYEVVAGQRRLNGARQAELSTVKSEVVEASDKDARTKSIRENFRNKFAEDPSPADRAMAVLKLWQEDMGGSGLPSSTKVGEELNTSKGTISDWIEPLRPVWEYTPVDPRS